LGEGSGVVGPYTALLAVNCHGAAVRKDALGSGVTEWDAHDNDGPWVVSLEDLEGDITLAGPQCGLVYQAGNFLLGISRGRAI
jgi:hypothetical protein